jgi:N-acyl amino acid synthase of PEP-CTERM/exosortase system
MYDTTPHALGSRSLPNTPIVWDSVEGSLLQRFNSHFKTLPAVMPEHILQAQKIRYQVYCVENPLETALNNPEGIETDEFDSHAVHSLLIARETGAALGTVRLIMPLLSAPERSFALQRLLDASSLKVLLSLPISSLAEVSRFSISRHFRRLMTYSPESDSHAVSLSNCGPLMRLGLIQGLVRMSMQQGITHWCALMEPTLLRMLAAMAIRFRPIGPMVEFRGRRQPCYINVHDMLEAVMHERPAFGEMITDGGTLIASSVSA